MSWQSWTNDANQKSNISIMDGDYQVQRTVSITIIGGIFGEISIVNTDLSKLLEFFFGGGGGWREICYFLFKTPWFAWPSTECVFLMYAHVNFQDLLFLKLLQFYKLG